VKPRCVVFDFDGTLADTIEQALIILNQLSEEYDFKQLGHEEIHGAKDMTASQFVKHLKIPRMKVPRILKEGKKRLASRVQEIQPIHGMDILIRNVRSRHDILGILTSNSSENVQNFLRLRQLDCFDFISTIPKLSGKAKNLKAIMRTHSLTEDDIIYVGDEIRDIKASKKAGVPVIGVTWGFNSEKALKEAKPDYLADSPEKLDAILESL
jgi:HAD superfamily hydrolase (TIGR01549 family)